MTDTRIRLTNARLSFSHFVEPYAYSPASKPSYRADFIFSKDEDYDAIMDKCLKVVSTRVPDGSSDPAKAKLLFNHFKNEGKVGINPGEKKVDSKKMVVRPAYADNYFISAKCNAPKKPQLFYPRE